MGEDTARPWWRDAVIYEVYLRSFADGDGNGEGDLAGLRSRLPYLAELGVDGIWITPWYPSPMADGGYDVSDYRDIDPRYGTLADADALIADAHALGLRVIIDIVANHTSEQHPWFQAALAAEPGSPERERYLFRDGGGESGELPPNNWISCFGGIGWTRVTESDGRPGQWYQHSFAPEQPDLNWLDEGVLSGFDDILRFWFDRGIDGIRADAVPAMAKAPGLPDADYGGDLRFMTMDWVDNPHWDVDHVHDIFRRWRTLSDSYEPERIFVAEAVVGRAERLSKYVRPDEMHTAFNFPYMKSAWNAASLRAVIDTTLDSLAEVNAPATWVTASHDDARIVSRYGRPSTAAAHFADGEGEEADLGLGRRRARAGLLLTLGLPGGAYIYQGEELGLPQVEDLPDEVLQDPTFLRSGGEMRGRDGCRVPLPWADEKPPFGFSPGSDQPWLPQPEDWADLTVARQSEDPGSMLALHREVLRIRREVPGFASDDFAWLEAPEGVLAFSRGHGVRCVVNISGDDVKLDPDAEILVSSIELADGVLSPDAAVWLQG